MQSCANFILTEDDMKRLHGCGIPYEKLTSLDDDALMAVFKCTRAEVLKRKAERLPKEPIVKDFVTEWEEGKL